MDRVNYIYEEYPTILVRKDPKKHPIVLGRIERIDRQNSAYVGSVFGNSCGSYLDTWVDSTVHFRYCPIKLGYGPVPQYVFSFDDVDHVIFSGPATIVIFKDGTKDVVRLRDGETDDRESAILWCVAKHTISGAKKQIRKLADDARDRAEKSEKEKKETESNIAFDNQMTKINLDIDKCIIAIDNKKKKKTPPTTVNDYYDGSFGPEVTD